MTSQPALFDEQPKGSGLDVTLVRNAVDSVAADAAFVALRERVAWRQDYLRMFGRLIAVPRLESWVADEGLDYTYSGIHHDPDPWSEELLTLRNLVSEHAGATFNSVLCNLYRDGNDGVDWHADDESEFGPMPVIGSLSLGATRRFDMRRVNDHAEKVELDLHSGDLLIMRGTTQALWRHRVPKTKKAVGERINLTFRLVMKP
ncbi:MAG: alpha-ketoglutarate-dependent dioxygenase AlkB [Acidimicrobiia bacterium]|nr:alpha-ketoglutarate-dependent dioxygenase AlkB [Acidimicrobiia bacterium]